MMASDPVGAILASLRTGLAAFAPDGATIFANESFQELLGAVQRDGARTRPVSAQRLYVGGRVIDVISDPLPGGGWAMTATDVSALARADEEAPRRASLLYSILDAFPHGVCVYGPDHRVTMFNRAYTQIMAGAPLQIGDHLDDIIRRRAAEGEYGAGDADEIASQQRAFDIARPQMRKRRRPNGTTLDVRTTPLPDGGYISVVTDITQLAEAEAQVSRRADELAFMLSNMRHGVMLWAPDRRLIASNAVAAELMRLPPSLLTPGRSEPDVIETMWQRGYFRRSDGGERPQTLLPGDGAAPVVRRDVTAEGLVLDFRSDPTPDGGWVSTFTDVTEARAAQDELRRAKEAAEAANHAKSRFLATMSHELRTPLHAVIGFSEALLHEAVNPSPSQVAEFATQINAAGRQLLGIINGILDVARIESGRFDLASDQVDVARLVQQCLRHADAAAQAGEIVLVADVADGLPRLKGDERRLQQVLNHLLSNAVKFTEAGGTVSVGAALEADGRLLLFVRDTGIGIAESDMDRVFEPFTQLDSTLARRFQGVGLGLYVSRALITEHGGELTLRSMAGEGTLVEIRLPTERVMAGQ
jgi:signal transduction histidine kinase